MSDQMVCAVLSGDKSMTRRSLKTQPLILPFPTDIDGADKWLNVNWRGFVWNEITPDFSPRLFDFCPYGKKGDVLYVRESYYAFGWWIKEGKSMKFKDFTLEDSEGYMYKDSPPENVISGRPVQQMGWYKRSSLFMPKSASRVFLKITNVGIERLNDISVLDVLFEGISEYTNGYVIKYGLPEWNWDFTPNLLCLTYDPITAFRQLWNSINGIGSWNKNPYVWVVSFERTTKPNTL